jgi:hypothetical protein
MIAFPAGRLREKGVIPVKVAMLVAAIFSAIGFLTIANTGNYWLVLAGYSVLGGSGAGLATPAASTSSASGSPRSAGPVPAS